MSNPQLFRVTQPVLLQRENGTDLELHPGEVISAYPKDEGYLIASFPKLGNWRSTTGNGFKKADPKCVGYVLQRFGEQNDEQAVKYIGHHLSKTGWIQEFSDPEFAIVFETEEDARNFDIEFANTESQPVPYAKAVQRWSLFLNIGCPRNEFPLVTSANRTPITLTENSKNDQERLPSYPARAATRTDRFGGQVTPEPSDTNAVHRQN